MSTMKSAQTVYYGPSSTTYPSAGSVSKGEAITALWTESTWCYIEYSVTGSSIKQRGYVPTNTINLTESVRAFSGTNSGMRYVQAADCPVYFGPNAITYPTCGSLSFREEVQYLGVKANNPSFVFIEYDVTGSTKKKRAWVYANNLATALPETTGVAIYTEGTKINSAGDYWHITQGWNGKMDISGLTSFVTTLLTRKLRARKFMPLHLAPLWPEITIALTEMLLLLNIQRQMEKPITLCTDI